MKSFNAYSNEFCTDTTVWSSQLVLAQSETLENSNTPLGSIQSNIDAQVCTQSQDFLVVFFFTYFGFANQ